MYIFVLVQELDAYSKDGPSQVRTKSRLEDASGEPCLVVPYQRMSARLVEELKPRAIVVSGFGNFEDRKVEWFYGVDEVFHQVDLPMLCFCGGHQLLAHCLNQDIRKVKQLRDQPLRRLSTSVELPRHPSPHPRLDMDNFLLCWGFYPVTRLKTDPLFRALPKKMIMRESHRCEVKKLPKGYELIATSDTCRVEAMRHKTRPIYGTQFHPETYEEPFLHGRTLLENFARIVDRFWADRGASRPTKA